MDFLDIKVDVVFKEFFGDKNSKEILESFINSVFCLSGDDVVEFEEFLDPRKMRVEVGKPTTFIDLSVKTKGGERYIIEMQTYNHEGFDRRLLYYLGKDYTEQIDYSKEAKRKLISWRELPRVHIIALMDFHRSGRNGVLNDEHVLETYRFLPEVSLKNNHLFDQWKATLIDLKKFKDVPFEELTTYRDKWFFILKNSPLIKEKLAKILKKDPRFKSAIERLERLSSDPKTRKAYEESINEQRNQLAILASRDQESLEKGEKIGIEKGREEGEKIGVEKGQKIGIEKGREEGREQGAMKRAIEIAQKMLKRNRPIEEIIEDTGLSKYAVEEIKKEMEAKQSSVSQ